MTPYTVFKLAHILTAMWFVTGVLGRQVVRAVAKKSTDVEQFALLTNVAGRFEKLMVVPGNMLTILFGVAAAWLGHWPILGFLQGAPTNWLLVSNLILVASFFLIVFVFLPGGKVFDRVLEEALAAGRITLELTVVMNRPATIWAHRAEYIGLLVLIFLMVTKPF